MKLNRFTLLLINLTICLSTVSAQELETYLFPINPQQKNYLAGTMGELRASHFHAGIDIKTGGQEGAAVLATKSGYITRIKIATSGYGHALYLLHPDGNTSVYAHMKHFSPAVEAYLRQAQYEQKTYEIELFPEPGQFSFKRGQEIGKSGNTGGSTGPHLHFEIRDENQKVLNPLHYGFTEIKDNIPPIVQKFALTPKNASSRIEQENKRKVYGLSRQGFNYSINDTINAFGKVGLELLGHDKLDGAANKNGISILEVKVNGKLYYKQNIDKMSFATQSHIKVHYPYDVKVREGSRYHRLYIADGNQLNFYQPTLDDGWLNIAADSLYQIEINLFDPYQNNSSLKLLIKGEAPQKLLYRNLDFELDQMAYEIQDNVLKVFLQTACLEANNTELSFKLANEIVGLQPAYYIEKTAVYTWNLHKGLPESILSCGPGLDISEQAAFPKRIKTFTNEHFDAEFTPYSLFDTVYVNLDYSIESTDSLETFSIGPQTYPLKGSISLSLKPSKKYPHGKSAVFSNNGEGDFSYVGGDWTTEDRLKFSTRELGDFTILTDTLAPSIKRIENTLSFIIQDELSGIKSFEASLNDQWVLMKYEPKDNLIWIEWLDEKQPKTGSLKLTVTDKLGNENSMNFNLK